MAKVNPEQLEAEAKELMDQMTNASAQPAAADTEQEPPSVEPPPRGQKRPTEDTRRLRMRQKGQMGAAVMRPPRKQTDGRPKHMRCCARHPLLLLCSQAMMKT